MNDLSPRRDHNRPPSLIDLTELTHDTQDLADRAHELVICADERAEVVDDESASKGVLLLGQIKDHIETLEKTRVGIKEPYLEAGRLIDRHFHAITIPLAGPEPKKKLEGAAGDLLARIDGWRRQRDAEIAAERARLEEEARRQREAAAVAERARLAAEAEAERERQENARKLQEAQQAVERARTREEQERARRQAEEARGAQAAAEAQARLAASQAALAERQAQDEAARFSAQAAATVSRPIDSGVGVKASGREKWAAEITNLKQAVDHCLANGYEKPFRELTQRIYDRLVSGKTGARCLPGARVIEGSSTTVRRK